MITGNFINRLGIMATLFGTTLSAVAQLPVSYTVTLESRYFWTNDGDASGGPDPRWTFWMQSDTSSTRLGQASFSNDSVANNSDLNFSTNHNFGTVASSTAQRLDPWLNCFEDDSPFTNDGRSGDRDIADIAFRNEDSGFYNSSARYPSSGEYRTAVSDGGSFRYGGVYRVTWRYVGRVSAPTSVSATDNGASNVGISWAAADQAEFYDVYRNTTNNSATASVIATSLNGTSYTDTTAARGTSYFYWVRAYRASNDPLVKTDTLSSFSNVDAGLWPKLNQTITFTQPADKTFGDASFPLNATASSGLPVSFSLVSGPGTVTGDGIVTILGAGIVTLSASQSGNDSYNSAPNVERSFTSAKANQAAITWSSIPPQNLAVGMLDLAGFVSGGTGAGSFVFGVVSGPATVSGSTATFTGAGDIVFSVYKDGDADFNTSPAVNSASVQIIPNLNPENITLSPDSIAENPSIGTLVGDLAAVDPNPGDTFTFSLVPGTGDSGNSFFTITDGQLFTAAPLDHEAAATRSIRVRATDSTNGTFEEIIIVTISDDNFEDADGDTLTEAEEEALGTSDTAADTDNDGINDNLDPAPLIPGSVPTAIALAPAALDENLPIGTSAGTLTTTDADAGETFTYTLVTGTGSANNNRFTIVGDELRSASIFDQETNASFSVRIRVTDSDDNFLEAPFIITINDLTTEDADNDGLTEAQEAAQGTSDTDADSDDDGLTDGLDPLPTTPNLFPTAIALSPSSVSEGKPVSTTVGTLIATDPDAGETFSFQLVSGSGSTHNSLFSIAGNQLRTAAVLNDAVTPSASIRVRVTDSAGHTLDQVLIITVIDASTEFTVVAMPDVQNYSEFYPEILKKQTRWIVDNAVSRNIKFVTQLGDLTNHHDRQFEWDNARSGMDPLDAANIPWGAIPGNHDFLYGDGPDDFTGARYLAGFGPQRFAGKTWYKGASPSQLSNYQIIDFGPKTILFLHLNLETPASELAWAQGVINANRNLPVWVSTHRYMQDAENFTGGVPLVQSGRFPEIWYTFEPLYRPDGMKSEVFFNSFVRGNKNIFMVHCGHFHAEYRQTSTNNFGLTVHEILADYQDDPNGGDGWMRLCTFRPAQNQIFVQTLSPTFNNPAPSYNGPSSNRTGSESQFTLNVNLDQYTSAPGSQLVRFQNGVSGYSGTEDTWVNSDTGGFLESDGPDVDTNYGNSASLEVDNDWDNSPFGDEPTQAMIKFTNITQPPVLEGDPIPTKVPTNATITRAVLSYNVTNDTDIGDEDMLVYRCNKTWAEATATWNSLGSGLSGSEIVGPAITVDGDNVPDEQTVRNVAVTNFVSAWFGPSAVANNGFAILPENTPNNDDGMTLASSESQDVSLRPALDIEFTYPVGNRAPAVTPLASSSLNIIEGQSIVLTMAATDANPSDPVLLKLNGADVSFGVGSASYNEAIVLEQNGIYNFAGQVSDDEATVSGGTLQVTVANAAPSIVTLTGNLTVQVGENFAFAVTATDPGVQDILTYAWDLDADSQFDDATGSSGSHRFLATGIYPITVRVSDGDGGIVTGSFTVTVADPYIAFAALYNLTGGKTGDDDGDGFSNEIERILGSLPNDANDRLTLSILSTAIIPGTGNMSVNLCISELRPVGTYRLYWSPDLAPADWQLIRTINPTAPADDAPVQDTLTGPRAMATSPRGFYQLRFEAVTP